MKTLLRSYFMALCCVALVFLSSTPAAAAWLSEDERPSRLEQPVPKNVDIPRFKNTAADPAGDTFGNGAVQLDLIQLSAEVVGSDFVVSMTFGEPISAPDSGRSDALDGYVDLDLDQDGATGDFPWTDLLRGDAGTTGMGNEAYVDIRSYDGNGNVELMDDSAEQPLGRVPLIIGDRTARVLIPLALLGGDRSLDVAAVIGTLDEPTDVAPNQGTVASSDGVTTVLLQNGRFEARVLWADFDSNAGLGRAVEQSDDSALFYFFEPSNWELMVKVLDACELNSHFWVFISGSTNVEYTVTITDTESGLERAYGNPLGRLAVTVGDTEAFNSCP